MEFEKLNQRLKVVYKVLLVLIPLLVIFIMLDDDKQGANSTTKQEAILTSDKYVVIAKPYTIVREENFTAPPKKNRYRVLITSPSAHTFGERAQTILKSLRDIRQRFKYPHEIEVFLVIDKKDRSTFVASAEYYKNGTLAWGDEAEFILNVKATYIPYSEIKLGDYLAGRLEAKYTINNDGAEIISTVKDKVDDILMWSALFSPEQGGIKAELKEFYEINALDWRAATDGEKKALALQVIHTLRRKELLKENIAFKLSESVDNYLPYTEQFVQVFNQRYSKENLAKYGSKLDPATTKVMISGLILAGEFRWLK